MYRLSPLLRLRWSDILTFCPSTHPHDFLHLKLYRFFLSLFFFSLQAVPLFIKYLISILRIRIRNGIIDFGSYFPLYISI